jgi:hypothetical protein
MNYRILIVFFIGLVIGLLVRPFFIPSDIEKEEKLQSDNGSRAWEGGRLVERRSVTKHSTRPDSRANSSQDDQDQPPLGLNAAQLVLSVDQME